MFNEKYLLKSLLFAGKQSISLAATLLISLEFREELCPSLTLAGRSVAQNPLSSSTKGDQISIQLPTKTGSK